MIRVIVRTQDCNDAAHVENAKAVHSFKTFDLDASELEAFLTERIGYASRQVDGVEIIQSPSTERDMGGWR